MNRFENVDVLAALEQLMRQNTAFHRDDYNTDKEIIGRATVSDKAEDKTLLWMSRPSGTYCFRESDVFLQGTPQHNTWKFYGEQTVDRVGWPTAVELTGRRWRGRSFVGECSMCWTVPPTDDRTVRPYRTDRRTGPVRDRTGPNQLLRTYRPTY